MSTNTQSLIRYIKNIKFKRLIKKSQQMIGKRLKVQNHANFVQKDLRIKLIVISRTLCVAKILSVQDVLTRNSKLNFTLLFPN